MSGEQDALLEFNGKMSSEAIRAKMEVLGQRRVRDADEICRLKTILAERKYGKMTLEEAGNLWTNANTSGRRLMIEDIPELFEDLKEIGFEEGCDAANAHVDDDWDNDGQSEMQISEYFARYCK